MNTKNRSTHPIGIYDSGIGGLTVTKALIDRLPNEGFIYFGDTAHHPYGEKSRVAIQSYSIKIANMLLEQDCKLILIACNSASSAAYELLQEYVGTRAIVMNVIDPMVHWLSKNYAHKKVGLIGTKQTVSSNIYKRKIDELNKGIQLCSYPTNLLASAIEEFGNHELVNELLQVYLAHPSLDKIEALVLACTHYPIVKDKIAAYYQHKIDIIDSSHIVADAVKQRLSEEKLLNSEGSPRKNFYISDYIESFAAGTKLFFQEDIVLEHYPLWD